MMRGNNSIDITGDIFLECVLSFQPILACHHYSYIIKILRNIVNNNKLLLPKKSWPGNQNDDLLAVTFTTYIK